jgi:hypothetical protein
MSNLKNELRSCFLSSQQTDFHFVCKVGYTENKDNAQICKHFCVLENVAVTHPLTHFAIETHRATNTKQKSPTFNFSLARCAFSMSVSSRGLTIEVLTLTFTKAFQYKEQ